MQVKLKLLHIWKYCDLYYFNYSVKKKFKINLKVSYFILLYIKSLSNNVQYSYINKFS